MKKAVSLKYDREKTNAPLITAKGNGAIAQNIIDVANLYKIPIKKDEDLLQMLSQIEINEEIPTELYKAVAEVFSFIYEVSNDEKEKENK